MTARRIGLVLGAGGVTGLAFHAGTLLALENDLGWNPNSSELIVGSSAGSVIGGLLRANLTTDDLAAWSTSVAPRTAGRASRKVLDDVELEKHRVVPPRVQLPIPSPALLRRLMVHPSQFRMHTAAITLLPRGWINAAPGIERVGNLLGEWPARSLWITAVRTTDARRVVFGRDDIDVTPGRAIAASCAIPAYYRPVKIGHHRYIDGGAHSPTNADVLANAGVDVVVVLSPMSGRAAALRRRPDKVFRSLFSRRLRRECSALERAGIEVHVFEPDASTLGVMGMNALDRGRSPAVVRASFLAAGAQIADNEFLRGALRSRSTVDDQAPVAW
jgi:NTE family protein